MGTSTSDQERSYSKPADESHLDLLSHGKLSDVTFIVGPRKERIPCHQAFLAARSPVFDAMFSERWNQDKNQEIPLEDIDPKIFKKFLQFIYSDTIVANVPEALELLKVAHTYDVQLLFSRCEEFILENEVTWNDALDVFQAGQKYDKIQLMDKAGDFMARSLAELLSHPSFSRVDKEILVYILKKDRLDMKEVDLFGLAVKWAKNQDDLTVEQSLEDILPLIRFPTMTQEEFTTAVVPTGLLSQSKLVEIFTYFGSDAETRESLASTLKFSTQRRRSTAFIHDLYPGDLDTKTTRILELENIEDSLEIRTNVSGTTAMGISGISVSCPASVVSTVSRPVSSTFKEFSIVLKSNKKILLSMSPVKLEEGKITEIKFDTAVPLANCSTFFIIVEEISRSNWQLPASMENFYAVKVFDRGTRVTLTIIDECVFIESLRRNEVQVSRDNERPQLICRLGLEKL